MPLPPGMTETEYPMEEIPTYNPGETIRVKVRLQPFRTDPVWREFSITVPEDFPSGSTMLYIHGGGDLMSWNELGGKGRSLWGFGPIIDTREFDLDSIISQIVEAPLNNELLLTLARPYEYIEPGSLSKDGNNSDAIEEEEPEDHIDEIYQMEWVIYNSFFLPINILSEEDEAEIEEMLKEATEDENGEELEDENDREDEYDTGLPF